MRELSLFTGGGGGIWGSKLLGWSTVGYVECELYCQKIISQRIEDGIFDRAPIFSDVRAFLSEGYAASYTEMVDVVTAGFPCQPFSVAGERKGEFDPRNMWPQTSEIIGIIRPQYALLENVPGLTVHKYFGRIIGELTEMGYDCSWTIISAAEVGAPHQRDRLWILAHANYDRHGEPIQQECERWGKNASNTGSYGKVQSMADSSKPQERRVWDAELVGSCSTKRRPSNASEWSCNSNEIGKCSSFGRERNRDAKWWQSEPDVGRVAHGVAARSNRLRALGNGQVPRVVVEAWERLAV